MILAGSPSSMSVAVGAYSTPRTGRAATAASDCGASQRFTTPSRVCVTSSQEEYNRSAPSASTNTLSRRALLSGPSCAPSSSAASNSVRSIRKLLSGSVIDSTASRESSRSGACAAMSESNASASTSGVNPSTTSVSKPAAGAVSTAHARRSNGTDASSRSEIPESRTAATVSARS
ncbi:Uncharacterised protein [Mycobacteroides abscessus subsp. abscessus]|nr:Uncharacterised protein [Mycobacteroides abscessus subsp. abscessus]